MMKFGAFIDGGGCAGWVCEAGEKPYFATSLGDLKSDCTYITNLNQIEIQAISKSNSVDLKPINYLGISVSQMSLELAFESIEHSEIVTRLAKIFSSFIQFGMHHSGVNTFYKKLYESELLSKYKFKNHLVEHRSRDKVSSQLPFKCDTKQPYLSSPVTVYFNRFDYFEEINSISIPSGKMVPMPSTLISGDFEEFIAYLGAYTKDVLIKINIEAITPELEKLIDYGVTAWVTKNELLFLIDHMSFSILEAYSFENSSTLDIASVDIGKYARLSYSYGLYLSNLWSSFKNTPDEEGFISPTKIWVNSFDRVKCLQLALSLQKRIGNFQLIDLGSGKISFSQGGFDTAKLSDFSSQYDLIPSLNLSKSIKSPIKSKSITSSGIIREAMYRGALDFILELDRLAKEELEVFYEKLKIKNEHYLRLGLRR